MPRCGLWSPCPASGSLLARQHPGRRPGPGSRNRSASLPPYDAPAQWEDPAMAGSREAAKPDNVADATGNADGHGLELILRHVSWLRRVIAGQQLTEDPGAQ